MEIKTQYYTFKYLNDDEIINFNERFSSPEKVISDYKDKLKDVTILGFGINHESEYIGYRTKILIEYNKIYYYISPSTIQKGTFNGRVQLTNENALYYLYAKRPINESNLKITNIPTTDFIKSKDRIEIECTVCGFTNTMTVNKFFQNKLCKKCTNQIPYDSTNICNRVYECRNPNVTGIYISFVPFIINGKDDYLHLFCSKCESSWNTTTIHSFVNGKTGCPRCNKSKGENNIKIWLTKSKIDFVQQKRFDGCKNIRPLPFDFYIESMDLCIEYDGEQHFKVVEHFGGEDSFNQRILNDQIKTKVLPR